MKDFRKEELAEQIAAKVLESGSDEIDFSAGG